MGEQMQSRLALHLPDANRMTGDEVAAVLNLRPAAMLVICYAQWETDRGVAEQVRSLVRSLGHDRLYVRFHADPNPPHYATLNSGDAAWGRLCARRMTQYYHELRADGVQLHAILGNEVDADYEGGLSPEEASSFYRRALAAYADERPGDILHVPAPTGAPDTHRKYLQQYKSDGWLVPDNDDQFWPYWIDGHGYNGDLENVLVVLEEECPGANYVITETNNLDDFTWPLELLRQGRVQDIVYFILNWARGGEGRPPAPANPDDADKRMSLMRYPDRYDQFRATIKDDSAPEPEPEPEPEEPVAKPQGIDVASYQGFPDWEQVAGAGYRFAVTKFTEGLSYVNPTAIHNWQGMKRVGIKRMGYHWGRPTLNARQQAEFFWSAVEEAGGWEDGDLLVLDMEESGGDEAIWSLEFLDALDDRIPQKACVIYTGSWFTQQEAFWDDTELSRYHLWLAAYQGSMPNPPAPWDHITFWQFSSSGRVPGIDGDVDLNEFNGTLEELRALGRTGAVPVEPDGPVGPPDGPGGPPETMTVDAGSWRRIVSGMGYLAGDLAEAVEQARAKLDDWDTPPDLLGEDLSTVTKAQITEKVREWERWAKTVQANADARYAEFDHIKSELQRVGRETL